MNMRQKFITKDTNIFYKHHNIHITISKPVKIIETDEEMNDNNNEFIYQALCKQIYTVNRYSKSRIKCYIYLNLG